MKRIKNSQKVFRFFKFLYLKLFRINDTPQRIALGFGLGVFTGIMPGTGPLVALFLAFLFRVNRASALLASLLTNTWLSFMTFILSIKLGSAILKSDWKETQLAWDSFIKGFQWPNLLKSATLKIIFPVMLGYLVIAIFLGLLVYIIIWIALKIAHRKLR